MQSPRNVLVASAIAALALPAAFAQSGKASTETPPAFYAFAIQPGLVPAPSSSTSWTTDNASLPDAPTTSTAVAAYHATQREEAVYHPFLSYAVAFRLGLGGLGGEIATPLARRIVLRAGVEAFSYSTTFTTNGLNADGSLKLGTTFATLDFHPFTNGFRVSPGITLYNRNNVSANLAVPGGSTFTLNDVDYTSDPTDPIAGTASATFGHKVAPRLTIGWGNSFPRYGGHWSFPVELGFYYTSYPTVSLALHGSGCTPDPVTGLPDCGPIDDPSNQANITGEQTKLNNDLAPARFFPVFSVGVGYRFGH